MDIRAEVSRRVRADLASVVDEVVSVVRQQVPAYAELSPAQQGEVRAIASWAIERVLELWVADQPPLLEALDAYLRTGSAVTAARS